MFQRARQKRELLLCLVFLLFSLCFTVWFLVQSGGTVSYPSWSIKDDHLRYQLLERSLVPLLPLLVLLVNGVVLGLTLWGLRRQAYLASISVCLGTLLLFSITLQAFFAGYGKHLFTLAVGAGAAVLAFRLSRVRPAGTSLLLSRLLAGAILALTVAPLLFGATINGARAWLRLGGLSLQPGQLLLPVLIWFAAIQFPCRSLRDIYPFLLLCLGAILSLCFVKDLGGAAILVALLLVTSWYLTDRLALSAHLLLASFGLFLIFIQKRSSILSRFNVFQAFEEVGGQQYQALYPLLSHGLHGSGVSPKSGYTLTTAVTYTQNDLAALLPLGILGLGAMLLVLLAFAGLLLGPGRSPAASPYHTVLHSGAVTALFAQAVMNLGGSLNVLPFTGVIFPILSSGGSSMFSTGALLGFCLSAIVWGSSGAGTARPRKAKVFRLRRPHFSGGICHDPSSAMERLALFRHGPVFLRRFFGRGPSSGCQREAPCTDHDGQPVSEIR